jgi:hypothetical protein
MSDDLKFKNGIQGELEELSWAFLVEESIPKEEEDFLEEVIEKDEEIAEEGLTDGGFVGESRDIDVEDLYKTDQLNSLYAPDGEYNVNDMGRNSGLMFDESKLEKARVTEWHRPAKLREGLVERFARSIGLAILWPFRAIYFMLSNFFVGLYSIVSEISKFIFKIVRAIVIFPFLILRAFKYSFIYLFGDFSRIKKVETEVVAVAVSFEPKRIALGNKDVWKRVASFAVIAILLVIPFQVFITLSKTEDIKGKVLGSTQLGLTHLHKAGTAGTDLDFTGARGEFELAEKEFDLAEASIAEMGALATSLGSFVPDVDAGQKLLSVAKQTAQIGQHLSNVAGVWDGFSDTIDANKEDKINWQEAEEQMNMAVEKAYLVQATLDETDLSNTKLESYSEKFGELKEKMPQITLWLEQARDMFSVMAHFIGSDEPRRWMVVFQNNSELRPTGGFMGSYTIVDVRNGKIKNISVPGGGFYDLKGSMTVSVDAPYPFHLFSPVWQPWNANWFPDYPTSAEKIMWFYDKSGGSTVDGVITFTPNVLEAMLELTGEIEMPEYETAVNAENFVRMAQIEVELEYDVEENKPKKFIGDLMPKVIEGISELPQDKMLDLWSLVSESLSQKHFLMYFRDESIQEKVSNFGWTGEIVEANKDYLSVIHTNIAGGKTDRVIDVDISHEVEITEDGSIIDKVIVTKKHNGKADDVFEGHVNTDYIRFYVPEGSKLLATEGFDPMPTDRKFQVAVLEADPDLARQERSLEVDSKSQTRITREFGKTVFGNWMSVAPGESKCVEIKYLLPFKFSEVEIASNDDEKEYSNWDLIKQYFFGRKNVETKNEDSHIYSLIAQKQAGTENYSFESNLVLADNWEVKDYLPESVEIGDSVRFKTVLDTDKLYGVVIERD